MRSFKICTVHSGDQMEKKEMDGACRAYGGGVYRDLVENVREIDHCGEPGIDGRIILRRIFRKWDVDLWTGLSWPRIETAAGTCECGNESSGCIKFGKFLDYLQTG
jgi:hypothetical protein